MLDETVEISTYLLGRKYDCFPNSASFAAKDRILATLPLTNRWPSSI